MGERLSYSVSFGKISVGSGVMRLVTADSLRGHAVWRATLTISGGFWMFSVRDSTESWFDPHTFSSRRFIQEIREPRHSASRAFEIFPERATFQPRNEDEVSSVAEPMDDVSLVYFARTLPLEPGQCYELHRYFKPKDNPVVLRVVKRDKITVPAGTFDAILVQPELTTSGIFSKKGRADLWLSDDPLHIVLQLNSALPFGSINLYLSKVDTVRVSPSKGEP